MHLCYVDESGSSGLLTLADPTQEPAFVIGALLLDRQHLLRITNEFLRLKHRFYPATADISYLDSIQHVVKGSTLRRALRTGGRRNKTHALGFLDGIFDLLEEHNVQIVAKALLKGLDVVNSDAGVYGSAIMFICESFQQYLADLGNAPGQVIADSRHTAENSRTSHTIFTQMFRLQGNSYPCLTEMPTYGYPHNHAMLQLADIMCSAILFPMLAHTFCQGLGNAHAAPQYATISGRFKARVQAMQYRYQNAEGYWRGGIFVTDGTGQRRTAAQLFR